MKTHINTKPLARIITVATVVAAVAVLSGIANISPAPVLAQGSCPYAQTDLASTDLGFTIARAMNWSTGNVNAFRMEGPYVGGLGISAVGGTKVSTSDGFGCSSGTQSLSITKGTGPVDLFASKCDPDETKLEFRITMPDQCDRNGGRVQSTSRFKWRGGEEGADDDGNAQPPANGNQPGTETGNEPRPPTTTPYVPTETMQLDPNTPGCEITGTENPALAFRTMNAGQDGPRHLNVGWTTSEEMEAIRFCMRIEHKFPEQVPNGVADFPEDGFKVSWMRSWLSTHRRYRTFGMKVGGDDFPGMYPGATYIVSMLAIGNDGDYGPASSAEVSSSSLESLGSVTQVHASQPYSFDPDVVKLRWQGAAGHPRFLYPSEGTTVTIEWKEAGNSYSPERMEEVKPNNGYQVLPSALYWGEPRIWYSWSVRSLEMGKTYTFRLIPKSPNYGDGPPAEITYRTVAPTASAMTRHAVNVTNYIMKRLGWSRSNSPR